LEQRSPIPEGKFPVEVEMLALAGKPVFEVAAKILT